MTSVQLDPARPAVALIARPLDDPAQRLPLVGALLPRRAGATAGLRERGDGRPVRRCAGHALRAAAARRPRASRCSCAACGATTRASTAPSRIDARRLPAPDRRRARQRPRALARAGRRRGRRCSRHLRALAGAGDGALLEFAAAGEIRALSLRIFDRSFAVTYWLQAVAIAIGLFGIAASFSAQVLARRKEFGLLAHLGLHAARRCSPWSPPKARCGRRPARCSAWLLGLAVSVVLVQGGQPAELPLDDGPARCPGAGWRCCARRCSPPAR